MNRILTLALVALIATPFATGQVAARVMESGDAAVAQKAMPAVVNISTWKVKQPEKEGDSPRRVKTYGSGFIIDPSGIIVTNKHVIDGAIDIKVTLRERRSRPRQAAGGCRDGRPCGGEGGCRSTAAGAAVG